MRLTPAQLKAQRAGKPLPRKEGEIQAAILAYLRTVPGVRAERMNSRVVTMPGRGGRMRPVRFGFKGCPDIIGWRTQTHWMQCCPPNFAQFLAIEVKSPGKEPTDEQRAFLQAVRDAGGVSLIARSVDDVVSALGQKGHP